MANELIALGREYPQMDVWRVAAAAADAMLSLGYANLRRKGLPAASAASLVDAELRTREGGGYGGGSVAVHDSKSETDGSLLAILLSEGQQVGQSLLELARGVFIHFADGTDLHHVDLLLRLMTEGAMAMTKSRGQDIGGIGGRSAVERRLSAHGGLVRRLLKAAPQGLNYKRLVGVDPLADPLADPTVEASTTADLTCPIGGGVTGKPTQHSQAGITAARARAMAELRSVVDLDHVSALSKLAARIPGLTGSALYVTVAQRVLCGETGGLSKEALELLRGSDKEFAHARTAATHAEEAASASVYHLLAPLLRKMTPGDLVDAVRVACAPASAGNDGLGFPCRRPTEQNEAISSSFPDIMQPLHLTVGCRRRILAEGVAVLTEGNRLSGGGDAAVVLAASVLAEEELNRLGALLVALDATTTVGNEARTALEAAFALTCVSPNAISGEDGDGRTVLAVSAASVAACQALAKIVLVGTPPSVMEVACSSMRAALGVQSTTMVKVTVGASDSDGNRDMGQVLDPRRVYQVATSTVLSRLARGHPDERASALDDLHAMCAATGPRVRAGGQGTVAGKDAAARAWGIVHPILDQFCREGTSTCDDGSETTPAVVLWARAEVLTILRRFDELKDSDGEAVDSAEWDDRGTGNSGSRIADRRYSRNGVDCRENADGSKSSGDTIGSGCLDDSRKSPRLSVSFLRVAELVMEAFAARVSPEEVESWQARSTLMELLMSHTSQLPASVKDNPSQLPPLHRNTGSQLGQDAQQRLHTIADILLVWETEALEEMSPSVAGKAVVIVRTTVERIRQERAEAAVRAVLQPAAPHFAPPPGKLSGADRGEQIVTRSGGIGETANAFMRQWWPKLISAAVDVSAWVFVSW